jgi:subtilisin family serine protease
MRLTGMFAGWAAAALLVSLAAPVAAAGPPRDYLVVTTGSALSALPVRVDIQRKFPSVGAAVVSMTATDAERLDRDPNVVVTEDGEYRVGGRKPGGRALESRSTWTVAGLGYQVQRTAKSWGLDRVDQRRGLDGSYRTRPGVDGRGVHVYMIDSGLAVDHPEFAGRVGSGVDFVGDGQGVSDCNGHGTHVAGTIGGATWGVAKGVRLVPVRVFGCTGGSANSTIIAGIDWVAANAVKPAVANLSLGGGAITAVDDAVKNLADSGVTVAVAAGNSGADACNYSPARAGTHNGVITVAATNSNDGETSWSNYGGCVDIWAPGAAILSTANGGGTTTMSGTSMASPHAAGTAARYLSGNTGASASTTEGAMKSAAQPLPTASKDGRTIVLVHAGAF